MPGSRWTQAEAATQAARRAARPARTIFAVGFLTGQEAAWLAPATRILSSELPSIEIRVSSGFSVTLADDLVHRRIDVAFLRHEPEPDLEYKLVLKEPLVAILPRDHRLAARKTLDPHDLKGETFIGISEIRESCAERSTATSNDPESRSRRGSRSTISPWRCRW